MGIHSFMAEIDLLRRAMAGQFSSPGGGRIVTPTLWRPPPIAAQWMGHPSLANEEPPGDGNLFL
jgi:hypothetical protein